MKRHSALIAICLMVISLINPNTSFANLPERVFCVWDPIGANGPFATMMEDVKVEALNWGVKLKIRAYTDEKIATNDFKAGQCDGVAGTEISVREFNSFTGSIGAVGALPTLKELHTLLHVLAQPKAEKYMTKGPYEVIGILPLGPIYPFVKDRSIDDFKKFKGKKMATFDVDPIQRGMAQKIGATAVPSSLSRFSGQYNNGSVDIVFAPATAYMPMELYKGVNAGGGIIKRPLLQASLQFVIRKDQFPERFGAQSRAAFADRIDEAFELIKKVEKDIPPQDWIMMDELASDRMDDLFRASRVSFREEGIYNAQALTLMRKVRCKHNPSNAECSEKTE